MAQNYEVFLADKRLLICREIVDNSAFAGMLRFDYSGPDDWQAIIAQLLEHQSVSEGYILHEQPKGVWRSFKKNFKRLDAAGGVVRDEQGRLLAIRRLGVWDLPKGKLEKGESIEECALREVEEECGITGIELGELVYTTWHTYVHKEKDILKRTYWFAMKASSDQDLVPQHEEHIERVEWLDVDGVSRLMADTYSSIRQVLRAELNRPRT